MSMFGQAIAVNNDGSSIFISGRNLPSVYVFRYGCVQQYVKHKKGTTVATAKAMPKEIVRNITVSDSCLCACFDRFSLRWLEWTFATEIFSPGFGNIGFGHALDVTPSGDFLAVGAPWASFNGRINSGAVYIFRYSSMWALASVHGWFDAVAARWMLKRIFLADSIAGTGYTYCARTY